MIIWILFLELSSTFASNLQELNCEFDNHGSTYGCRIISANITREDISIQVSGLHMEFRTNANVLRVHSYINPLAKIEILHPHILQMFSNLNQLDLMSVSLKNFSKKSFDNCNSIVSIKLSYNKLQDIPDRTFSKCRVLKRLDLSFNMIFEMSDRSLDGLDNLEFLNLNSNPVKFASRALSSLINLKTLYLQNFQLNTTTDFRVFQYLVNLETIDLSCVHSTFDQVKNLINLLRKLKEIILTFNYYSIVDFKFLSQFDLRVLRLDSNILSSIPPNTFENYTNLLVLSISLNYITSLSYETFVGLHNLDQFYIGNNNIAVIPEITFDHFEELTIMDISYNEIQFLSPRHFQNLTKLKLLSIQNNRISFLQENLFMNFGNLVYLFLDRNNISSLSSSSFGLKENLTYLSVSSNLIKQIEENFFDNFPNLYYFDGTDNLCSNIYFTNFSTINVHENFQECFRNWWIFTGTTTTLPYTTTTKGVYSTTTLTGYTTSTLSSNTTTALTVDSTTTLAADISTNTDPFVIDQPQTTTVKGLGHSYKFSFILTFLGSFIEIVKIRFNFEY